MKYGLAIVIYCKPPPPHSGYTAYLLQTNIYLIFPDVFIDEVTESKSVATLSQQPSAQRTMSYITAPSAAKF